MVTGDQLLIGKETARQLGLGTDMYSTEVLLSVSDLSYIARNDAACSRHTVQGCAVPVTTACSYHIGFLLLPAAKAIF